MKRLWFFLLVFSCVLRLPAQVTYERLLQAEQEPENWLTYSGSYSSQRYSKLKLIDRNNVGNLILKWVFQMKTTVHVETSPLIVDGIMYVTDPPNKVHAIDTRTGRTFWSHQRALPGHINRTVCCGLVNRGLAILGDKLYWGTLDAHLIALDSKTGSVLWDVEVADYRAGYAITSAPLAVKNMVITGIAGGEYGIRGFVDAYDSETGKQVWRFYTVPGPGEPGNETWEGDSWKTGGAPTWVTGSFDPGLNLIYWGTGNPGPDWDGSVREGDNLYSSAVVALDADSGKLRWHYQFTPHDVHDWDAAQIPVLVDAKFQGRDRKLMLWGNRNAFYYILDRETGKFLLGKAYARQTWSDGFTADGRPIVKPNTDPTPEGNLVYPGLIGATNWFSPSYSPKSDLFYLSVWEDYGSIYFTEESDYKPGDRYLGGVAAKVPDEPGRGVIRALDPWTGELKWEHKLQKKPITGLLSTAGGLVFGGSEEGYFYALDSDSGEDLWRINTGGQVRAGPVTYLSEGKQLVSIASGSAIFTFELQQ